MKRPKNSQIRTKIPKQLNETPRVKTLGPPTGGVFLTGGLHPWAKSHTVSGTRHKTPIGLNETSQEVVSKVIVQGSKGSQIITLQDTLLHNILQSTEEGIYGIDEKGRCFFINPATSRIIGYSSNECLGKEMHSLIHYKYPDGRPFPRNECRAYKSIIAGKPIRLEEEILWKKDGTPFNALVSCAPIKDKNSKKIIGSVVTLTDITKFKKAEEALHQSEEKYRLVVENTNDLISMIDLKGNLLYVSPSFNKSLGYTLKELKGISAFSLLHHEDVESASKAMQKVINGEVVEMIYRIQHKKGFYLTYSGMGTVIKDSTNKPYMIITTSHDITQQTEIQKQKDEFISIASHELKTPITTLKSFTEILQMHCIDQKSKTYLTKMNDQIDRLTRLINDLLDVSKIQSGKLVLQQDSCNIDELIKDIAEDMQFTTQQHTISIIGKANCQILVDKYRISQVLVNLLSNAIKYSPKSEKINIIVTKNLKSVVVTVQDFGIGISKKDQGKVFEPFFQANSHIRRSYSGLGLGLHISLEIIKRHGGDLWVKSEKGKGSEFSFSLPLNKTM